MRYANTLAGLVLALSAGAALAETGQVWKNPSCGCCKKWVSHMASKGSALTVTEVDQGALDAVKAQSGITQKYASCHTAKIGGYTIEGHVPAAAVTRLLAEKPDAVGLAVPGMPAGSPGMETGGPSGTFDVLLINTDGSSQVFEHITP